MEIYKAIAQKTDNGIIVKWWDKPSPAKIGLDSEWHVYNWITNQYKIAVVPKEHEDEFDKLVKSCWIPLSNGNGFNFNKALKSGINIIRIIENIDIQKCSKCIQLQGQKENPDCCNNHYIATIKLINNK